MIFNSGISLRVPVSRGKGLSIGQVPVLSEHGETLVVHSGFFLLSEDENDDSSEFAGR
jgi:hypothetical protein